MVRQVRFQNFRALRDVEITFDERLTILVGPNGCGKSSVLQGLHILGRLASGEGVESVFSDAYDLSHLWSNETSTLVLEAEVDRPEALPNPSIIRVQSPPDGSGFRVRAGMSNRDLALEVQWPNRRRELLSPPEIVGYPFCLAGAQLIRFSADRLGSPSERSTTRPRVAVDGAGLATTLCVLQGKERARFDQVVESFRRVIPSVRNVRFDLVERNGSASPRILDKLLVDFDSANGVPSVALSDGTLYVLGLLTILYGSDRPRLLLCDDLDHGLHPKAQMELIRVLRELIDAVPDLQIIATSHSLYVLDELPESAIRVMTSGPGGGAVVGRLSDHHEYKTWKESMSPGEFWSHVGEDWLLKKGLVPAHG
jgi:ABC-type branched-subunit amino acid transport system ATPase component